jgi:hypothetical protein
MIRKELILTAIVLAFAASDLQAEQISCSWVGCEDGLWSDPSNWSCGMVPDNNETYTFLVTIDTRSCPPGFDVRLQQNRTIDRLDTYGDVDLEKRLREDLGDIVLELAEDLNLTLSVNDLLTNHGSLGAEVIISGNVTNTSGAMLGLYEDKFILDGNLYNQAGAMIEVADDIVVEDGNIDNAGVIMLVPNSMLVTEHTLHNAGQINVYGGDCGADEIFDNNSTGTIAGYGTLHGGADLFRNKGKIYAFGGSLAVGSFGAITNSGLLANKPSASLHIAYVTAQGEDVNNNGTIEVNAGGGVAFDCNLVNEPNATISLLGGTLAATSITQSADANFTGFGGITGDLFIDPNAIIELTGPTNIVGDVTIDANSTLEISDGTTLITGHTTCNNGTIYMIGGRVICQGGLTNNNCNIIWKHGIYTNMADCNLDGTVNFKDFAYFGDTWLWQADWYTP